MDSGNSTKKGMGGSAFLYALGLAVFIAGYAGNDWIVNEQQDFKLGVLKNCTRSAQCRNAWICNYYDFGIQPAWFVAVFACMTVALILAVIGFLTGCCLPITSPIRILAGLFGIVGVSVFGHYFKDIGGFNWAYGLCVAGSGLFIIDGIIVMFISSKNKWSPKPIMPVHYSGKVHNNDNQVEVINVNEMKKEEM